MNTIYLKFFLVCSAWICLDGSGIINFNNSSDTRDKAEDSDELSKAVSLIDGSILRTHAEYLSSDELGGRFTGQKGEEMAVKYISGIMKNLKLEPAGDLDRDGERMYTQQFKMTYRTISGRETITGQNCIGVYRGSDPVLKDEYIVIGAHHDHIGNEKEIPFFYGRLDSPTAEDDIYNGADDNASGVSTLLVIAEALSKSGIKLKRSVVFITFSGEEIGLFGSKYYVSKPVDTLQRHILMINLDMVGGNKGKLINVYELGSDKGDYLETIVQESSKLSGLKVRINQYGITDGDSDHTSFKRRGVPVMFFFSEDHDKYHKIDDHAEFLDYERMEKTAKCIVYSVQKLANAQIKPVFDTKYDLFTGLSGGGKTLGISSKYTSDDFLNKSGLHETEGALFVNEVKDGSVAYKCGILSDDIIVKFNGERFPRKATMTRLRDLIQKTGYDQKIPIEIIRNGKRIVVEAVWEKESK
ncbi:MAG: M20/M25/M40 family metallo-hydrolase [Planctomycetes bacterium]|nr:M20/M25/M40 family metallo-hydrolase [Planctomycetota bacterium]